jgi:digeranylgeranylglycerophospholipid reductase
LSEWDVVIVGAGPAGSSAASALASAGHRVLILEKREVIGHPVKCGEFMPEVDELEDMLPSAEDLGETFDIPSSLKARPTESIVLVSPKGREYGFEFAGYSTWRERFDSHLADMARKSGAELRTGTKATSLVPGKRRFAGVECKTADGDTKMIRAKVVVGADGPNSLVARCAGFERQVLSPAVKCIVRGEFDDEVRMFFGSIAPGGYAWVIPKKGAANVGVGAQKRYLGRNEIAAMLSKFLGRIEQGERVSPPVGGSVPMDGPRRETARSNVILVGDAAGHVMATNGGGVPTAMICGRIAGKVVSEHLKGRCDLLEYDREWRRQIGRELETARSVKRLADRYAFGGDRATELCMRLLGRKRLERAVRCRRLFL